MLDSVLEFFGIVPDIDLDLMQGAQTLTSLTSRVLTAVGDVLDQVKPDVVVVQGDTTTLWAQPWLPSTGRSLWGTWKRACAQAIYMLRFLRR